MTYTICNTYYVYILQTIMKWNHEFNKKASLKKEDRISFVNKTHPKKIRI